MVVFTVQLFFGKAYHNYSQTPHNRLTYQINPSILPTSMNTIHIFESIISLRPLVFYFEHPNLKHFSPSLEPQPHNPSHKHNNPI